MRTFIAIPLPAECREVLDRMQQALRAHRAGVRWVAVTSIHLTLKFLGEVEAERIRALSVSLRDCAAAERRFDLRLHGLGCFPNTRNPRVLWCGIDGQTDNLLCLQRAVETACTKLGFVPEERGFRPHLTLGRIQGRPNLRPLMGAVAAGSDLACAFSVERFHVYKSSLRPQGAVYTILDTIELPHAD